MDSFAYNDTTFMVNETYNYDYDYDTTYNSYATPTIVIHSVLLYIGLCTNIWMLWSLYKTWEAGSRAQFYLLALCIAETFGLIIYCPLRISQQVMYSWWGGYYGCKIAMGLWLFGSTAVHYIMVGFNVDNVVTIIRERPAKTLRIVFLILAILCAVAVNIPNVIFYQTQRVGSSTFCSIAYHIIGTFSLHDLNTFTTVVFPLGLVIVFGGPSLCLWCAKKGSVNYEKFSKDDSASTDMSNIGRDIGLVIALDVLFIICWIPLLSLYAYIFYNTTISIIFEAIAVSHGCLIPIVYAVVNHLSKRRNNVSPAL